MNAQDTVKQIDLYLFKIKQLLKEVTYEDEYDLFFKPQIEAYKDGIKEAEKIKTN